MLSSAALLSLLPLASAHFLLTWPTARGFNDDTAANFPCGGFGTPDSNRTEIPLADFPIQLEMHHTSAYVQVLLGLGNDPGSAFNLILRDTFLERGPNNFCIGDLAIPDSVNLTAGMNATIQVVTNGDPDGGLYQCADITITSDSLSTDDYNSHCTNSSGVTTKTISNPVNANETSDSDSSSTTTASSSSSTATASTGAGPKHTLAAWALSAVGVAAGAAALL